MRDDVLQGLGASDCKAGLAAQIYTAALLKRSLLPLQGNLIVAATVSEEQGGSLGLRHLMRDTLPSLEMRPDYAILGEPTALSIYYGHDGSAMFEVLIEGPDSFQVNDATQAVFENFRGQYRSTNQRGRARTAESRFAALPTVARLGVRRHSLCFADCRTRETVGGMLEQIKQEARAAAASVARVAVNVTVRREEQQLYTKRTTILEQRVEAWSLDPYHPLIARARQALAAAGCPVSCGKWQLPRLGMGTAGGVLVNEFHVPAIGYGPGSEDTCHVPNESVSVARFESGHLWHGRHRAQLDRRARVRLDGGRDLMMNVLVFNCGSSSLKYRLIAMPDEQELSGGEAQRIGPPTAKPSCLVLQSRPG